MSVKKTFENLIIQTGGESEQVQAPAVLDLVQATVQQGSTSRSFEMDAWPILLFLRGLGFEKITFHPRSGEVIDIWASRVQSLENEFIQDPENFTRDEYDWNERAIDSDLVLIECAVADLAKENTPQPANERFQIAPTVPPMSAPLGITHEAANHFLEEVKRQSPQEIFQRILSILVEYKRDVRERDDELWSKLVEDLIGVALRSQLLDKAVRIAEDHQTAVTPLWKNHERLIQTLGAFDPKPSELGLWASIFSGCEVSRLLDLLEKDLSSHAGPQILKIMNYRAQKNPEELMGEIHSKSHMTQKLLLQWLAPYWRLKHLGFLENSLDEAERSGSDEELFKLWMIAMLRSAPKESFDRFKKFFHSTGWFFKKKTTSPVLQRCVLGILSENPSAEAFEFLKGVRSSVVPELRHQLDTLLGHYRKAKT